MYQQSGLILAQFEFPGVRDFFYVMTTPLKKGYFSAAVPVGKTESWDLVDFATLATDLRICIAPLLRYTVSGHKGKFFGSFYAIGDT